MKICQLDTPFGIPWQTGYISSHIHNALSSTLMMKVHIIFSKLLYPQLRAQVTRTQQKLTYLPVDQKVPRKLEVVGTGTEHVMLLWYH